MERRKWLLEQRVQSATALLSNHVILSEAKNL
jgi:hypothetical protein